MHVLENVCIAERRVLLVAAITLSAQVVAWQTLPQLRAILRVVPRDLCRAPNRFVEFHQSKIQDVSLAPKAPSTIPASACNRCEPNLLGCPQLADPVVTSNIFKLNSTRHFAACGAGTPCCRKSLCFPPLRGMRDVWEISNEDACGSGLQVFFLMTEGLAEIRMPSPPTAGQVLAEPLQHSANLPSMARLSVILRT